MALGNWWQPQSAVHENDSLFTNCHDKRSPFTFCRVRCTRFHAVSRAESLDPKIAEALEAITTSQAFVGPDRHEDHQQAHRKEVSARVLSCLLQPNLPEAWRTSPQEDAGVSTLVCGSDHEIPFCLQGLERAKTDVFLHERCDMDITFELPSQHTRYRTFGGRRPRPSELPSLKSLQVPDDFFSRASLEGVEQHVEEMRRLHMYKPVFD